MAKLDKAAPSVPPSPKKEGKIKKADASKTKGKTKLENQEILGKRGRSPVASGNRNPVNSEVEQNSSSELELGKLRTRQRSYARGS